MIHLLFIIILLIVGAIDAFNKKIYDVFPLTIIFISVLSFIQNPDTLISGIIGFFALSVPMLILALLGIGIGGGDIKLTAACGLFLGTEALLTGFLIASLLALAVYLVRFLLRRQKPHATFAFGPYLAAGFIIAAFMF